MKFTYEEFLKSLPKFIAEWFEKEMDYKFRDIPSVEISESTHYNWSFTNWINYIHWDDSLLKRLVWGNIYLNIAILVIHVDTIKENKKIPLPIHSFILKDTKYKAVLKIIKNFGIINFDLDTCDMDLMVNSKIVLKNY
jgi:hypothetical protein